MSILAGKNEVIRLTATPVGPNVYSDYSLSDDLTYTSAEVGVFVTSQRAESNEREVSLTMTGPTQQSVFLAFGLDDWDRIVKAVETLRNNNE